MPQEVVIISVGMLTAVGLSAAETAASVRAGTAKFAAQNIRDKVFEPFIAAGVPDKVLPLLSDKIDARPLTNRETRMLRLLGKPLTEAAKPIASQAEAPALSLALPDFETRVPLDRLRLLRNASVQAGPSFKTAGSTADALGRAGGLSAIGAAIAQVAEGKVQFALAGGVDSYLDPYVLGTLDFEGRVKSSRNLDGFIPGEAAAFLLLASRSAADRLRARPLASISPVAEGMEPGHLYSKEPYLGDGLATTVQKLFAQSPPKSPIAATWSSMNGESHWGKEWGIAYLRSMSHFTPAAKIHHPADCVGDTGAAAGPLLVALAALGIAGGYREAPALVYCSSDRGQRAALIVSPA